MSGPIYTPEQYVMLVQTAKKTGTPYNVVEMSYDDFLDVKEFTTELSFNFDKDTSGETVKFSEGCAFKVERETLDRFYYKTSFGDVEYKVVNIKRKNRRKSVTFHNFQLECAYKEPLAIPKKKHDNLM